MREIEFKGYNKEAHRWYKGMLGKFDNKYFIDTGTGTKVYVEEDSISQYTEFLDKNKNKIYERDVLHWNIEDYGFADMNNGSWIILPEALTTENYLLNDWADKVEVIGNIYEEQLKEEMEMIDESLCDSCDNNCKDESMIVDACSRYVKNG